MFNRNSLPLLGVCWHYFATERAALRFARWAVNETRNAPHPCEASVSRCDERPEDERYEVRLRNW